MADQNGDNGVKKEHTSLVSGLAVEMRDRNTWDYEKDGVKRTFISFFTDSPTLIGFIVTADDHQYKIFKSEEVKSGYRVMGARIK